MKKSIVDTVSPYGTQRNTCQSHKDAPDDLHYIVIIPVNLDQIDIDVEKVRAILQIEDFNPPRDTAHLVCWCLGDLSSWRIMVKL